MAIKGVHNGLDSFHIFKSELQKWIKVPAFVNKEVKAGKKSWKRNLSWPINKSLIMKNNDTPQPDLVTLLMGILVIG